MIALSLNPSDALLFYFIMIGLSSILAPRTFLNRLMPLGKGWVRGVRIDVPKTDNDGKYKRRRLSLFPSFFFPTINKAK